MTTFMENTHLASPELLNNEKFPSPYQQPVKNEVNDFFVDHNALGPVTAFSQDYTNWKYVVSHLRQQVFNSTSTCFPAPESYFLKKAKNNNYSAHTLAMLSMVDNNATYHFNSDPFGTSDPLQYRRHRSENLLLRMINCKNLDMCQISLMRLSKGVFVHQKWQSSAPQSSPTLSTIEECLSNKYMDGIDEAPIDTFQFNNMTAGHLTSSCYDMFVPYSYTFGARYTNPYGGHDLVIRGKLPLWCQTLFLSVCMKQKEPIQPNVPVVGLFPFAPHVPVTFKSLLETENYAIAPELTLLYERFTMEHTDPYALPDGEYECQWPEKKQEILRNIIVCDLPDDLAKILDDMAAVWAVSQGLML